MRTILQNLYVMDFHCPGNLYAGLVQEALYIGLLSRKPSDIHQNANVTPKLVQRVAFGWFNELLLHRPSTSQLKNGAKGNETIR